VAKKIVLRDLEEINRAHDLLDAIVQRQTPIELGQKDDQTVCIILSVLCWVLKHKAGVLTETLLKQLEDRLKKLNFTLRRIKPGEVPGGGEGG